MNFGRFKLILILAAVVLASCSTVPKLDTTYPVSGSTNNAVLAVKDYQTVGIIFVESTEVIDGNGNHTGSKITYQMFMKEAQRLNADDVINIKIDINEVRDLIPSSDGVGTVQRVTYNYKGTALAIRYTGAIQGVSSADKPRTTGPQASEGTPSNQPTTTADQPKKQRSKFLIGAVIGGGFVDWYFDDYNYYLYSQDQFTVGATIDYTPIIIPLSKSVSFEGGTDVTLTISFLEEDVAVLIPVMAKFGPRFGNVSIPVSAGYTIGEGFTLGLGIDLFIKNGKFFFQYLNIQGYDNRRGVNTSSNIFSSGYKFSL